VRAARVVVGPIVLVVALTYLSRVVDSPVVAEVVRTIGADPAGLVLALACYTAAFALRARAWTALLPALGTGQSWGALHVALLGNHVLPFGSARRCGSPACCAVPALPLDR
jgi:uncharacterized membrane protein YbhN (UPF0104 family)